VTGSSTSSTMSAVRSNLVGDVTVDKCDITVTDNGSTATYAVSIVNGTGTAEMAYNTVHVSNSTNDAAGMYAAGGGAGISIRSMYNHVHAVAGAGTANSIVLANADTTVVSQFDDFIALGGVSNTGGTFTIASSEEDGSLTLTNTLDVGGAVTGLSFTADATSAPSMSFIDSDGADGDVSGKIYNNLTTVTSGAEIGDMYFQAMGADTAGTLGTFMQFDGSAKALNITGAQINTPETVTCVTEAGTASVTTVMSFIVTDGDGDTDEDTVTLGDGTVGQTKIFVYQTETDAGDSANVTPTSGLGFTDILFEDPGDGCTMVYTSDGWAIVSNNGGTIT